MTAKKEISLRLRLALLFSAASAVLFALMGVYVYRALDKEVSYRDDAALLGRIERMKALIGDSISIENLRKQPQLYANMLGNKENILWVVNQDGEVVIEINPTHLPLPVFSLKEKPTLFNSPGGGAARLAWMRVDYEHGSLILIAGKLLAEREQMMAAYRMNLGFAWLAGVVLAFVLGWEIVRRGLLPLDRLSQQAAAIDTQHLGLRLDESRQPHELHALTAALNLMLTRLEEGYASLSRFSEDLAHEMRTPLNNLMGQNQLALNQSRTVDDYENLLASQQEEYERLARMIDNILFLARAEKPESVLKLETVDLDILSQQLSEYFEGMAQERSMVIEVNAQGHLTADSGLIRRALANLLVNAIRYGAPNTSIFLRSQTQGRWLDIEVSNQGEPIEKTHLPKLFDRFYRCDSSRSNPDDSGGLGLAIVQSIMHMHKGQVLVESSELETKFTLRFHIDPHAAAPPLALPTACE